MVHFKGETTFTIARPDEEGTDRDIDLKVTYLYSPGMRSCMALEPDTPPEVEVLTLSDKYTLTEAEYNGLYDQIIVIEEGWP